MIGLLLLKRRPENTAELMAQLRALQTSPMAGSPGTVDVPPPSPELPTVPAGDLVTRFGNPPQDVADAIKEFWPPNRWIDAASLSYLESGWRNTAELNTLDRGPCGTRYWLPAINGWATAEQSVGIFQINVCAHGGTREYWHDPRNNARKGAELFAAAGWSPWLVSAGRLGLR